MANYGGGSGLPHGWKWPTWALSKSNPQIEVFVVDPDTGESKWLPGLPQQRVLDANGEDAFILVAYNWDGEDYVEDFEPRRIRRIASSQTVFEELSGASTERICSPRGTREEPAELVLNIEFADGVVISNLPSHLRAAAFPLDASARSVCAVGRQHQPEMFENAVVRKELLASISRSHFEIAVSPGGGLMVLRVLSSSPGVTLLLDEHPAAPAGDSAGNKVCEGSCLSFVAQGFQKPFLSFRLLLRDANSVAMQGSHPATRVTQQAGPCTSLPVDSFLPSVAVAGVLECVRAAGIQDLQRVPPELQVIPLPLGDSVDIGRSHQREVFEALLQVEPQWLQFVSRSHCKAMLSRNHVSSGSHTDACVVLKIENLSMNVLFIDSKPLVQGQQAQLAEGSKLAFLASAGAGETTFLEFLLRRARPLKYRV